MQRLSFHLALFLLLKSSHNFLTVSAATITFNRTRKRTRKRRLAQHFLGIELERTRFKLPSAIEHNLLDWDPLPITLNRTNDRRRSETPLFWHIAKSGGTTVKLMYATCYHVVEACETGEMIEAEKLTPRLTVDPHSKKTSNMGDQQEEFMKLQTLKFGEQSSKEKIRQQGPIEGQSKQLEEDTVETGERIRRKLQRNQSFNQNQSQPSEQWQLWTRQTDESLGPKTLQIVTSEDGRKYVNVDVTTTQGIVRASQLGFASSGLADVIFTPLLLESSALLFDETDHRGRLFAMFRHPVERVTSTFYYLQKATWEPTYNPEYASWSIDDYANSPLCESNWMVRSLVNNMEGPLSPDDVKLAKEIIKRKCLIGLMDKMEESLVRFHFYFGLGDEDALECAKRRFVSGGQNNNTYPKLDSSSETWAILARKNGLDILLYQYAQLLFEEQGKRMKNHKMI